MKTMRRGIMAFLTIGLVLCFIACKKEEASKQTKETAGDVSVQDITGGIEDIVDSIMASLTLEERLGQCFMPSLPSSSDEGVAARLKLWIEDYHIGGIVLLKGDLKSARKLAAIAEEAKVPLFVAIDAEWGLGMRLKDAPKYPKNGEINSDNGDIALFDYGQQIAGESRQTGINMILGPVIDVADGKAGVIGNRSFGSDPRLVSDFGIAYAKGLESGGIMSVAKHFPGHGAAYNDSHFQPAKLYRTISALDSIDLSPFRRYINSGLSAIMVGHIQSKALDPEGRPASVSSSIMTDLLRGEMGFKGLVITDAFDMGGVKGFSALEALEAGADIILCPADLKVDYREMMEAVRSGRLSLRVVNDRCRRILFYKALFPLYSQSLSESL